MSKLTKTTALEIARDGIKQHAENLLYTGKDAAEVAKFESASLAIIAKGESLDDAFFAAIPDDINTGIIKRGGIIARAIHAATKA